MSKQISTEKMRDYILRVCSCLGGKGGPCSMCVSIADRLAALDARVKELEARDNGAKDGPLHAVHMDASAGYANPEWQLWEDTLPVAALNRTPCGLGYKSDEWWAHRIAACVNALSGLDPAATVAEAAKWREARPQVVSHMNLPDGVPWSKTGYYVKLLNGYRWVCGLDEIEPDPKLSALLHPPQEPQR